MIGTAESHDKPEINQSNKDNKMVGQRNRYEPGQIKRKALTLSLI